MNLHQILLIIGICFWGSCNFQAHIENKYADKTFFAPENQPDAEPYYQFARRLETSINEGNPNFFNDNFDLNLLVSNLLRKTGVSTKTGHIFAQEVLASIDAGAQIVALLHGESNYKLLGISLLHAQPIAWFRLTKNGMPDYHRVQLTVAPTVDLVRIQDFCILSGGLSFSETLKMVLLGIIAQNNIEEETLNQLNAADLAAVKHAALLDKINIALHEKAFGRANKLVKQLPNELEGNKMLLLQQLNMGYHFKNELLPQTLQIYEQTFPYDAAARFSLLKLSIEKGDNVSAEKYAQDFAQLLPDADYLNVLRGQALYNLGQEQQAASIIREVMERTPNDTDVCKAIMVYLLNEERFADVVNLLEQMQGNNNIEPIKLLPAHAGFLNSETYKEWLKGGVNSRTGSKP